MTMLKSLGHYKGMTYKDSEFGGGSDVDDDEVTLNKKTIQTAKKRFGYGYSNEDYMFLENEYQDWATRHECNTKARKRFLSVWRARNWKFTRQACGADPQKI